MPIFFLLDKTTWGVSGQGMQDHLGAKSASWLAGWSELSTSFLISSNQAGHNPGMGLRLPVTTSPEWSDAQEGPMSNRQV